jgi:hypothetical protein
MAVTIFMDFLRFLRAAGRRRRFCGPAGADFVDDELFRNMHRNGANENHRLRLCKAKLLARRPSACAKRPQAGSSSPVWADRPTKARRAEVRRRLRQPAGDASIQAVEIGNDQ